MLKLDKITPEMKALLRSCASTDINTASAAQRELAIALTLPLKKGVIKGDNTKGIFEDFELDPGATAEFPLDFLSPGTEKDFIAYTIPNIGRVPDRQVEGDYVMVPTYDVGASIDWAIKFARDARWDVAGRAMEVLEGSFVRKKNNDSWHVLLASAVGRNLAVYDSNATAGLFTKRLVSLGKTIMRRNAGGNSTSINKGRLTDLYLSPESLEDIRSWDLSQIDEFTRREIFLGSDDNSLEEGNEMGLTKIFKVILHDIDEFGVGQEYQNYAVNTLGATLPGSPAKLEFAVGLDLYNNDSFVRPIRAKLQMFEDMTFHRQRKVGWYAWEEFGVASLDSRRTLMFAI